MVDIQSPIAEISQGKKKKERRKKDRNHARGKNIMSISAMQGGHNKFVVK